jgi:hypothetical protein
MHQVIRTASDSIMFTGQEIIECEVELLVYNVEIDSSGTYMTPGPKLAANRSATCTKWLGFL